MLKVEKTDEFFSLKEKMRNDLEERKASLTDGGKKHQAVEPPISVGLIAPMEEAEKVHELTPEPRSPNKKNRKKTAESASKTSF